MPYFEGERVSVTSAPNDKPIKGKIAGHPILLFSGFNYPVLLDNGLWTEGRESFIRIMLVNEDNLKRI